MWFLCVSCDDVNLYSFRYLKIGVVVNKRKIHQTKGSRGSLVSYDSIRLRVKRRTVKNLFNNYLQKPHNTFYYLLSL
jgi:hypothetical protein